MKKKIISLLLLLCLLLTGCSKNDVISKLNKKYNNLKSYSLKGTLEITNNEDIYTYDVKVTYQKNDNYNVSLLNKANNHEQIILKNENGVYVLTPSLNKSFKFQSDWPYNNSQAYLLSSIMNDINNDKEKTVTEDKNYYLITSKVNYPNNRKLINQIVKIDKDLNIKEVKVVDENEIEQMKMTFNEIELNPKIDKNTFDINSIMKENETSSKECIDNCEETVNKINDILYPLYIPSGTVLTSEEKINKDNGERVIMTFDGEKPFLLVEETANIEEEFSIIPTYGEPYLLTDTVGALTDSSITWNSNGIEYYIVSDVMSQDELVDIAKSIAVIGNMK